MQDLNKLSITEVLSLIDQLPENEKFYISFDNCHSSTTLAKKDKFYFLNLHIRDERYFDQKLFYKCLTNFKKNYFVQINPIKVTI